MLEKLPEFLGNHPVLGSLFVALILALVFTEIARRFRGFMEVSPSQLTQLINRQDAIVIDVSPHADFERGHIVNSKNVLPSQFDPDSKLLKNHKDDAVAVVCRSGVTCEPICKKLVKSGFSKVFMLKGGVAAWTGDQLPVTSGK
jgi:rhodanese-related sulfurtransferase